RRRLGDLGHQAEGEVRFAIRFGKCLDGDGRTGGRFVCAYGHEADPPGKSYRDWPKSPPRSHDLRHVCQTPAKDLRRAGKSARSETPTRQASKVRLEMDGKRTATVYSEGLFLPRKKRLK